jgi:hypothetical protein
MRTLTINERVDRITEFVRRRSANVIFNQCSQKAKWNCSDSLRCSHCTVAESDVSCGEGWNDYSHSDWSDR